ncbi:unnamed protein product [Acanthoscelides obtectus]|uniref:BED-type domain-containing protein n=1 Tax=Acanthoscelides obtectus TaxID=200917 RepID=A0A9P0PK43_ACAOB|nr:unnamed protein product [Acanthoscelides obtectus]CAK1627393.1 PiggyBac transposable element-derived protein 4 [Acanthoscelides obtectus]
MKSSASGSGESQTQKRSVIWMHFTNISEANAKSNLCKNIYSHKNGNISNLRKHLKTKHPTLSLEGERAKRRVEDENMPRCKRNLVSDEIIQLMVQQTNVRAREIIANKKPRTSSRFSRWHDTNEDEMELFIGVIMLMGVINFPTIESYWKKDPMYYHEIFHKISYNRFTLLLKCWHFQDNTLPSTSRLDKINPILSIIQNNIKTVYCPGDTVVVDETMVPFRGRLKFRQYNPSKARCSYGIKLYKVCTPNGYTWHLKIYDSVSTAIDGLDLPGSTVVELVRPLLNEGRMVITDNYYTSLQLAKYLYDRNTHLLGTLRKNRRGLPEEVIIHKLRKGEIISRQNGCITVSKWKDQRDVLFLSTVHDDEMKTCGKKRNGEDKIKPSAILDYNKGKQGVDISDQFASYYTCLRKSLTWYKKLAIEIICGTLVVNTLIIYNEQRPKKEQVSLLQMRQSLISEMLKRRSNNDGGSGGKTKKTTHILEELPRDNNKLYRKRCHGCYGKLRGNNSASESAKKAKRVNTICKSCNQAFCVPCFGENH